MLNGDDFRRRPFAERKATLHKALHSTRRGIQCVEHTEGDDREIFQAICKLGLEGIVSKETGCALSLRPLESVDKSEKSKGTRCHSRYGWNLLVGAPIFLSFVGWLQESAQAMTIAPEIELYNSAYSLAWRPASELQKRKKPNIASRLHDSIRLQIKKGATSFHCLRGA